ncbi:MAG: hypothetical protein H6622_06025 [Halobacteriovoraceae bacterium]|nr:hypothetical protein [Halobacteriovoraceae bacterium]
MKFILLFSLIIQSALALVDYSPSGPMPSRKSDNRKFAPKQYSENTNTASANYTPSGMFVLNTSFEAIDSKGDVNFRAKKLNFSGHFETPYKISLDFGHWMAQTGSEDISADGSFYQGNPYVKMNLNWFTLGGGQDSAQFDIFGQFTFSRNENNNPFASSRSDTTLGIETIKRFYSIAFGVNYGLTLTGTPENEVETHIGNIQKISAALGWVVSNDIQIMIQASNIRVDNKESSKMPKVLKEKLNYGVLETLLSLGISPIIKFELGAKFNTTNVSVSDTLRNARLWNLDAVYGNTISTGLNISI